MKVLICGWRDWDNYTSIFEVVKGLVANQKDVEIVEGECSGADIMARQAAIECEIPFHGYPAKWRKYDKAAGPIRNQEMLDKEHPDVVIAFHPFLPNSKGTKNMVELARKAGIPTWVIDK